jgi:hypothetical protein
MPGCPIRRSPDLMLVCSSPELIAAYHVLHRLSEPRHPPYALKCFKRVITITRSFTTYLLSQYVKELVQMIIAYQINDADNMVSNHWLASQAYLTKKELVFWWRISESNR